MPSQMGLMHQRWKYQWFFITAHTELPTIFYGNRISSNPNVPWGHKSAFSQWSLTSWPWRSRGWDLRVEKRLLSIQAHLALLLWIYTKSHTDSHFTQQKGPTFAAANATIISKMSNSRSFVPLFVAQNETLTKKNCLTNVCVSTFYQQGSISGSWFHLHPNESDPHAGKMTDKYFPRSVLFVGRMYQSREPRDL